MNIQPVNILNNLFLVEKEYRNKESRSTDDYRPSESTSKFSSEPPK